MVKKYPLCCLIFDLLLQYGSINTANVEKTFFFELSGSAWLRLFRYVDKMAAVEYEKCASIHTQLFDRFE